jgi:hypothetical protein
MAAAFTLELRRLAGAQPRYALRYACRNGRAAVAARPVWSVAEASLRSNGHREGLAAAEILGCEFVFVGFELADNGKFRLWHADPAALHRLPEDGPWVRVPPTPVQRSPFFSLDTDELEFERPWKKRKRPPPPPEPVTEPGAPASRWQFAAPPPRPQQAEEAFSRWDEREVLALPHDDLPEPTLDLEPDQGEVSDLLRVVSYLRDELRAERDESHRLQSQVAKLQEAVAALVSRTPRG